MDGRTFSFVTVLVLSCLLGGCGISNSISEIAQSVNAVARSALGLRNTTDNAIASLDRSSAALNGSIAKLGAQLSDTSDKLTQAGQTTLANEVNNLAASSIALTSGEARCDIDFVRARAKETIENVKSSLTLGLTYKPIKAAVCSWTPTSIDLTLSPERRKSLQFWGFNLSDGSLRLLLRRDVVSRTETESPCEPDGAGEAYVATVASCVDVDVTRSFARGNDEDATNHLHVINPYSALVNVSGNGAPVDNENAERLLLMQGESQLSDIAILQPSLARHKKVKLAFGGHHFEWVPPRVRGDSNFEKQCDVRAEARLVLSTTDHSKLLLRIFMQSSEPGGDFTEVLGSTTDDSQWVIFKAPDGFEIEEPGIADNASFHQRGLDESVGIQSAGATYVFGGMERQSPEATVLVGEFASMALMPQWPTNRFVYADMAIPDINHLNAVSGVKASAIASNNHLVHGWLFEGQCGNNAGATAKVSLVLDDATLRLKSVRLN